MNETKVLFDPSDAADKYYAKREHEYRAWLAENQGKIDALYSKLRDAEKLASGLFGCGSEAVSAIRAAADAVCSELPE